MRSPITGGGELIPIIIGMLGPYTSASMSPTRSPCFARATARFTDTVDLPTPPLPLEIAMMRPRFGYATGVGAGGTAWALGSCPMTGSARPRGGADAGGGGAGAPRDTGGTDEFEDDCEGSRTSTRTSCTPLTRSTAWRTSRTSDAGSCASRRIVKRTRPSTVTATSRIIPERMTSSFVRGFTTPWSACAIRVCIDSVMRSSARCEADGADLRNLLAQVRFYSHGEIFRRKVAIRAVAAAPDDGDARFRIELDELDVHGVDPEHGAHLTDCHSNAIFDVRCRALLEE